MILMSLPPFQLMMQSQVDEVIVYL
jgi:hypothetical protein